METNPILQHLMEKTHPLWIILEDSQLITSEATTLVHHPTQGLTQNATIQPINAYSATVLSTSGKTHIILYGLARYSGTYLPV